jgi:peptide chain release factor 3
LRHHQKEIAKRRTFGIISHPDAGKTTLTEKLLLFGGSIREAGAVKSNKIRRATTSDFMEIERQRGISVATSVMSFEYDGKLINILDTPGHKDFAEDTYRTLTAVDSVILVVDSGKGVEEQTEKLMQVCRMRHTPVIIFINKLDRDGKLPVDLMDELESALDIRVRPLTWPIGAGASFKGVYNLLDRNLYLFRPGKTVVETDRLLIESLDDPRLDQEIGSAAIELRHDVDLVEGVYGPFSEQEYLAGTVAPVFFGSALNNFGVRELLETFLRIAPPPAPRSAQTREVAPEEERFSGFVFKIHANLDPRHRDRIAFLRVCSGRFERDRPFLHVRNGKNVRFSTPYSFLARQKSIIQEAYPGDVIGLYDPDRGREAQLQGHTQLLTGDLPRAREHGPHALQAARQRDTAPDGGGACTALHPGQRPAQDRGCRGRPPVRRDPVPPGARVRRRVPSGRADLCLRVLGHGGGSGRSGRVHALPRDPHRL